MARSLPKIPPGRQARLPQFATMVLAAGLCLASDFAVAGDYYLRSGIGLDRPETTAFTDTDCSTTTPAALYGCGTGGDGAPYRSAGDFGTMPSVELGLGYETGVVRFEVLVEYRPDFSFDGRANFLAPERRQEVSADLSSLSGMIAGFVDLDALGVPQFGPFVPFIGAGIGAAHTRIGQTTMTFPATTTTVPGGSHTGLAWMATAGVALALSERVSLDLAWRYTDLGEVRTPRGPGRVVWRDGSRAPLPLDLAPTKARLKSHGVRLSLRYAF
ncbi:MAG: outer membrane beta-barrel protein [bacterium]|nr:outer membrane beta-barrel protein [bacterium]MDE0241149.1 outer membrane beta-barrel protein [bacterium]